MLSNPWVKEELTNEILKYFKLNHQNLWDTIKAVLRGKFRAVIAYFLKEESLKILMIQTYNKYLEEDQ